MFRRIKVIVFKKTVTKINIPDAARNILAAIGLFLLLFLSVIYLGNQLWFSNRINNQVDKIKNVLIPYPDYSIDTIDDVVDYVKIFFSDNEISIPSIDLKIKQTEVLRIHEALKSKSKIELDGRLSYSKINDAREYKIKIKTKGDRDLHYENYADMSFRIKIDGKDNFIDGLDRFDLQRPVIRNYTWEFLYSYIANREGLLTLKKELVSLSVNGDARGLYVLEETPTHKTIETQSRKNGPIFEINENLGSIFPNVQYRLISEKAWTSDNDILKAANISINDFRFYNSKKYPISDIMDIDKWAKFFALTDLFKTYHGAVPKSVILYYNPTTGLIEPIVRDSHRGAGKFEKFIFADFIIDPKAAQCEWICDNYLWFTRFFSLENKRFLALYLKYLEKYTSTQFISDVLSSYEKYFKAHDRLYYRSFASSDEILNRGLGFYHFDKNLITIRSNYLIKNIEKYRSILNIQAYDLTAGVLPNFIYLKNDVRLIHYHDKTFSAGSLRFKSPAIVIFSGKTKFINSKDNPFVISGPVMLVQYGGEFEADEIDLSGLNNFRIDGLNWSGAVNFIESSIRIKKIKIQNSNAEDAVNFISSHGVIDSMHVAITSSDAIDSDFSDIKFSELRCTDVGNDCLDGSTSKLHIKSLYAERVADKAVSAGESSLIRVENLDVKNSSIGLVSKDSSYLHVDKVSLSEVKLAGAMYVKKYFFEKPAINIGEIKIKSGSNLFYVDDVKNFSAKSIDLDVQQLLSKDIFDKMYGNLYGVKTAR